MRLHFLVWIFLIGSAGNAVAMKHASQAEIDEIEKQLGIAKGMDKEIRAAIIKQEEAVATVKTNDSTRDELQLAVDKAKARQLAARTKAIHMTILAWDIAPASLSGISVMPRTDKRLIAWQPIAGEALDRSIQGAKGGFNPALKPKKKYAGVSYSDGVTYIPKSTFDLGVSFLASVLLHERTHFDQYTSEAKRGMSASEREVEAYQAQVDNAGLFFDGKKEEDKEKIKDLKDYLRENKDKVKNEKGLMGLIRRAIPSEEAPNLAESNIHTNEELAEISALVAQARSQTDIARVDREKREAIARDAAEKTRQRDEDDLLREMLVSITRRSCSAPGSVGQSELDELSSPHRKFFYVLDDQGALPGGLGNCLSVYLYLATGGRNAEDLRRKATPEQANVIIGQPVPEAAVEVSAAPPPFSSAFPEFKKYAIAACLDPGRAPISYALTRPYDLSNAAYDNNLARSMASGLADCPRAFFHRMLEMYRARDWRFTDEQWIRETVAAYSRAPDAPPAAGGGRRKRCEDYGNIHCP